MQVLSVFASAVKNNVLKTLIMNLRLISNLYRRLNYSLLFLTILMIVACGGGGGADNPPNSVVPEETAVVKTGRFLDSPVANLGYRTTTQQGFTNEKGEFLYIVGEQIVFSIGGIDLPVTSAAETVTPLDIAATTDINNITAVNIGRLLQSLDNDANPNNGITISDIAHTETSTVTLDFASTEFDQFAESLVEKITGDAINLVSADEAVTHLQQTLMMNGIDFDNQAPNADAGSNQTVLEGETVKLLTIASNDSDGVIVQWLWEQVAGPVVNWTFGVNNSISFDTPTVLQDTVLSFLLTVYDEDGASTSDVVNVTVLPSNQLPIAVAGDNITINEKIMVTLDAEQSYDPDGSLVNYQWQQLTGEAVSFIIDQSKIQFVAPTTRELLELTFQLNVTDNEGGTSSDTVSIIIIPVIEPLIVDAGNDQTITEAGVVTLQGQASSPNGNITKVQWQQVSGTPVALEEPNSLSAYFTAPMLVESDLVFELSVTDDEGGSDSDIVTLSQAFLKNTALTGRVSLDQAVSGATISIYDLDSLSSDALCELTASATGNNENSGWVELPVDCVVEGKNYLLVATGGYDLSRVPSNLAVNGKIHAIIEGKQLIAGNWNVSMLTEVCYQYVVYNLLSAQPYNVLKPHLNECTLYLLKDNIIGDNEITVEDLVVWSPFDYADFRFLKYRNLNADEQNPLLSDEKPYENLVHNIYEGKSTLLDSMLLATDVNDLWVQRSIRTTAFDKQYAYLVDSNYLKIVNLDTGKTLSTTELPGWEVAVNGNYAYLSNHDANSPSFGFNVMDVSDVTSPLLVGTVQLPNTQSGETEYPQDIEIVGNVAYVLSSRDSSLYSIDIRDPKNPVLMDSILTPLDSAKKIAAGQDTLAIIGAYNVMLIDVSTPSNISVITTVNSTDSSYINSALIDGDILYLATNLGLNVINISMPESPYPLSEFSESGSINGLIKLNNTIYCAGNTLLVKFNTSDTNNISIAEQYSVLSTGNSIFTVRNNRAYWQWNSSTRNKSGIAVSALNSRHKPKADTNMISATNGKILSINDKWLVAASGRKITILKTETEEINSEEETELHSVRDIVVDGDRLYVLSGTDTGINFSIRMIVTDDVTQKLGEINLPVSANKFVVKNNVAFLLSGSALTLLDLSTDTLNVISTFEIENDYFSAIAVQDNVAYITGFNQRKLYAVDISNLASPSLIGDIDNLDANSILVDGDYAYLTSNGSSIRLNSPFVIVDISNPAMMSMSGQILLNNGINALDKSGAYVYASSRSSLNMQVVNVANPANPYLVAGTSERQSFDIKIYNNFVYTSLIGIIKMPIIKLEAP